MTTFSTLCAVLIAVLISAVSSEKGHYRFYRKCDLFREHEDVFICRDDETMCVSMDHYCDSIVDCLDGSDEDPKECQWDHQEYCDNGFIGKYIKSKPLEKWECDDGMCIEKCRRCDGDEDCRDGSDEDKERCEVKELRKYLDDIDYQCQRGNNGEL